ncbi:NB-ARC domain, LRR domain containing protein [Trema orientale]|uniref:NB-ARC domain, LRR domain containing protein n=1 Tax=Trema orientale TaxID=63057 RepID=A0A2P5G0R0_TREOI|nr:NB-ARC domain, LRR domain containing protein [Trema orientale]
MPRNKNNANHITVLLEDWRSKVRRLQDRPIEETEHSTGVPPMLPFRSGVAFVLQRLLAEKPNLVRGMGEQTRSVVMHLQLLEPFVKDLRRFKPDSRIDMVWQEEAQKIIVQAQNDLNTFLQEAANHTDLGDLALWPMFIWTITKVVSALSHLLRTKERYGFKFAGRVPSKGYTLIPHPQQQSSGIDDVVSILSALENIRSQFNRGQGPSNRVPDHLVASLLGELEYTRKLLKDQEATKGAEETKMACLKLLQKMLEDTQKLALPPIFNRISYFHPLKEMVSVFAVSFKKKQIENLRKDVRLLKRCVKAYRIELMEESCPVVGLEEDTHKLVLKLTTGHDQNRSFISIVGMKGIGKTTLAKEILNHRSIINHFPVRHFVSVPEETDEIVLLQSVGNQILKTQDERSERDYWIHKLQNFFEAEKHCLLVLDNLWSKETWDVLKIAVFSSSNTTVLGTTRDKTVASHANSSSIHHLRLRTEEESWEFFIQLVLFPSDEATEKLAKKVVVRTGGLPLAILRLGYLLSGKKVTKEELSIVLERVTQGQNQIPWVATKDTSKEDLRSKPVLKNCLSYFELFPRDSDISARRLVALWVAQGLVESDNTNGMRTQEKVAEGYLSELIDRNIIQIVERKLNGKVVTCRFPGILREIWLASRANNVAAHSWSLCASFDGKLAYRFDDDDASFSRRIHRLDHSNVLPEESCPLSIMFFDTREGDQPGEDVCNFLRKAITTGRLLNLVVLDLEHVFKPQLPSIIGKLKKLKYLGLRWTYVETLPPSIGELWNLQTLDLKHTRVKKLHSSIWKLEKLRNLHLNHNCRIKFMPQPNNLHKLSGVFLDDEGKAFMDGLHKLKNLRKLRLTIRLKPQLQGILARHILLLTNLQSLSLKSVNESSEPQELILEPLNNLVQLSSLGLTGKIARPSIKLELPKSLTELTLSGSGLTAGGQLLQTLGEHLPALKFLYFLSDSYCGTEMVFSRGFQKLLVLKLWNLPNLEKLVVEEGVMPQLRVFEVRSCAKLTAPTTRLTKLSCLKELKLTNMPEEYTAELRKT